MHHFHATTLIILLFHESHPEKRANHVIAQISRGVSLRISPANTLHKSNVILVLYFGNLLKLLSANVDVT